MSQGDGLARVDEHVENVRTPLHVVLDDFLLRRVLSGHKFVEAPDPIGKRRSPDVDEARIESVHHGAFEDGGTDVRGDYGAQLVAEGVLDGLLQYGRRVEPSNEEKVLDTLELRDAEKGLYVMDDGAHDWFEQLQHHVGVDTERALSRPRDVLVVELFQGHWDRLFCALLKLLDKNERQRNVGRGLL